MDPVMEPASFKSAATHQVVSARFYAFLRVSADAQIILDSLHHILGPVSRMGKQNLFIARKPTGDFSLSRNDGAVTAPKKLSDFGQGG